MSLCLSFALPSIHNNILSFRCPICQRCFNQKSNLKTHLLTHTDVKPKQLLELAERMERATGRKPSCGGSANASTGVVGSPNNDLLSHEPEIDVGTEVDSDGDEDSKPTLLVLPKTETLETKIEKTFGFSIAELMRK